MDSVGFAEHVEKEGFAVVADVLALRDVEALKAALADAFAQASAADSRGVYGVRTLLDAVPAARDLAASPLVLALVTPLLGADCFAVRGILFDKIEGANWKVPWHQDLSIAVRKRRNAAGFGPWSQKSGVVHAHAPVGLLARMLTVRLHLDDCDDTNGPLRVLPTTHRLGRLDAEQIQTLRADIAPMSCVVGQGGAVLMRPFVLHASSAAEAPRHRRVLHLEYAAEALPDGLEWHTQLRGLE